MKQMDEKKTKKENEFNEKHEKAMSDLRNWRRRMEEEAIYKINDKKRKQIEFLDANEALI